MRELLTDKYDRLTKEFKTLQREHAERLYEGISSLVGHKLYECRSSKQYPTTELDEWTVYDYGVLEKDKYKLIDLLGRYYLPTVGCKQKPTKVLIEAMEDYIEKYKQIPDSEFNVLFYVEKKGKFSKSSRGYEFVPGIGFEGHVSFDPESFAEKIKADREEYEKNYAPREGYVKCERCGKQVPANEVVKYKLIYRSRDNYGKACVASRIGQFCSGDCALNEQMSLEG